MLSSSVSFFFFCNDTATTEIYTLSLHDALPISDVCVSRAGENPRPFRVSHRSANDVQLHALRRLPLRSEEHTSELQSHSDLVCRLLLEKKKERKKQQQCRENKYN